MLYLGLVGALTCLNTTAAKQSQAALKSHADVKLSTALLLDTVKD